MWSFGDVTDRISIPKDERFIYVGDALKDIRANLSVRVNQEGTSGYKMSCWWGPIFDSLPPPVVYDYPPSGGKNGIAELCMQLDSRPYLVYKALPTEADPTVDIVRCPRFEPCGETAELEAVGNPPGGSYTWFLAPSSSGDGSGELIRSPQGAGNGSAGARWISYSAKTSGDMQLWVEYELDGKVASSPARTLTNYMVKLLDICNRYGDSCLSAAQSPRPLDIKSECRLPSGITFRVEGCEQKVCMDVRTREDWQQSFYRPYGTSPYGDRMSFELYPSFILERTLPPGTYTVWIDPQAEDEDKTDLLWNGRDDTPDKRILLSGRYSLSMITTPPTAENTFDSKDDFLVQRPKALYVGVRYPLTSMTRTTPLSTSTRTSRPLTRR
jgi:hypothetical protein